jgi:preprotein translocase subunit SecG
MRRTLLWLIVVALLVIAFVLYQRHSENLDVTPDAQRAIDKARQR